MKPITYLYLLAAEQDYRLLRTHDAGFVEIVQGKADATSDGVIPPEAHASKKKHEHGLFAKEMAAVLAAEWAKGGQDRIVIAAGPKMLGAIREALPKALLPHIAAELHKDLVKVPLHDLPSHFGNLSGV